MQGYSSGDRRTEAWHEADGMLTTASECIHGRCAVSLAGCYSDEACQASWNAFIQGQGRVPWNQTGVDAKLAALEMDGALLLQNLVDCFSTRCTCQSRDQLPHAVRFTGGNGLTEKEVASVLELSKRIGSSQRRAFGIHDGGLSSPDADRAAPVTVAQGHSVTFLHHVFSTELPELHAKLVALAQRSHDASGWKLLDASKMSVRTMELLDYSQPSDSLGWHVDEQSAVTLLVMLSDPEDFQGAELQHEVRGRPDPVVARMARGDVTAYRSHQAHRVTPLTGGRRRVMAVEFWHDAPGRSPWERPHRRYGQCPA